MDVLEAAAVLLAVLALLRYLAPASKQATVCRPTKLNTFVLEHCPSMHMPVSTPFWLCNATMQIAFSMLCRRRTAHFRRQIVTMKDGGNVALDWFESSRSRPALGGGAIIVVLSTLTGGAQNVADFCTQASRAGHEVVVFVKRGHGGLKLATPRLQAFGDTSDLQHCLDFAFHIEKVD